MGASLIAGLALSGAGTIAQSMALNDAAKARSSALQAERIRQSGHSQQQQAAATASADSMKDFTGDQARSAEELAGYFRDPVAGDANAAAGMIAPEGTSDITVREMANQSAKAKTRTNAQADSLGKLRAFDNTMGSKNRLFKNNASVIDQANSFRRGSQDALAYELEAAAQRGAGKKFLGDLLSGAGSIATSYGAFNAAPNQTLTGLFGGMGRGSSSTMRPAANPFY